MKKSLMARFLAVNLMLAMVVGILLPVQKAEARDGGFGGGNFRGGGSYEGARGGQVAQGPRGGAAATGPEGASAVRSPYGGAAARGPEGAAAVRSPYGGGAAVGPGGAAAVTGPYGAAAVRGPQGNVAAGYRVSAIPATATPVIVAGQTYYVDSGVYYQQVFDGSEVVYIVVPVPQE
ncbi:hypothetical protein [Sulfuricaulis sp.]|jgi:hypothetical protein|uniref:hypothetical protein n=1 Tax=Sulfuricaulis sp. TaxID=2003553 RepID=UPI00355AC62E